MGHRSWAPVAMALALWGLAACGSAGDRRREGATGPKGETLRWVLERPTFFEAGRVDPAAFRRWAAEVPLPAVSEDGAFVALGRVGQDGARGHASYRAQIVRVRDGEVVYDERLISPADVDAADDEAESGDAGRVAALVAARVDRANDRLAAHRWVPFAVELADLATPPGEEPVFGEPFIGPIGAETEGGLLTVVFESPRLVVRRGELVLHDAPHPEWLAERQSTCEPEEEAEMTPDEREQVCTCHNPPTLEGGLHDPARGVLLLRIGYLGSDVCWEPDTREAVITLPR